MYVRLKKLLSFLTTSEISLVNQVIGSLRGKLFSISVRHHLFDP